MKNRMTQGLFKVSFLATLLLTSLVSSATAQMIPGSGGVPDLTKGGELTRINKRWAGPIGIFCGAWRPSSKEHWSHVKQIKVLEIAKGSPAEGVLLVNDVILGMDASGAEEIPLFDGKRNLMTQVSDVINEAEAQKPSMINLKIFRPVPEKKRLLKKEVVDDLMDNDLDGMLEDDFEGVEDQAPSEEERKREEIPTGYMTKTVELEYLGAYSDTAPYNCDKSKRILRKNMEALYKSNQPGKFNMGILTLIAGHDPTNPNNEKYQAKAKEWTYNMIKGLERPSAWNAGVSLIILSEYYMLTKDEKVFPSLVKLAEYHASRIGWFGTSGHRYGELKADGTPGGRMAGYGPIGSSISLGLMGLSLAREAGVKSDIVEYANRNQRIFASHYTERGGITYGEFAYWLEGWSTDANAKYSLPGMALGLEKGMEQKAKYFQAACALSSVKHRTYAHGGPFFGLVFAPLAAAKGGQEANNMHFDTVRWHLDLKRHHDGTRIYDPTGNDYGGFSYSATALVYALPLRNLVITGKNNNKKLHFTEEEMKDLRLAKDFKPEKFSDQELVPALARFFSFRKDPTAKEIVRRMTEDLNSPRAKGFFDEVLSMATNEEMTPAGRAGAGLALIHILKIEHPTITSRKEDVAKAIIGLFKNPDPYINFIGRAVMNKLGHQYMRPYLDDYMDAVIRLDRPTFPLDEEDPFRWAHGVIGIDIVKMLIEGGMEGVNREKLYPALRSALKTPDGGARGQLVTILELLPFEDFREIAEAVEFNVRVPPEANAMGGSGAGPAQASMVKNLVEEGMALGKYQLAEETTKAFGQAIFNSHYSESLMKGLGRRMFKNPGKGEQFDADGLLQAIEDIPAPKTINKLKVFHKIQASKPILNLPDDQTSISFEATNYLDLDGSDTSYTWRKVYGPGKVDISSSSSSSKMASITFTDKKPGKYSFEVTMSDSFGYSIENKTIDIIVNNSNGELPSNNPPEAISQSLQAVPGLPLPITLTGKDPDGDELGFKVTQQPKNGRLSGKGGQIVYTALYGFRGTDSFSFEAIDGQGISDEGRVELEVSDKNIEVAVYEGFEYTPGPVGRRTDGKAFGFKGPWVKAGRQDGKIVAPSFQRIDESPSLAYPSLPATGSKMEGSDVLRPLDTKVLKDHNMLNNGQEMWFSFFASNFPGRGWKTLEFRGSGFKFGFSMGGKGCFTSLNGKQKGTLSRGWAHQKGGNMFIGRCLWGKTDGAPDSLEIFRVYNAPKFGPVVLDDKPICKMEMTLPQQKINVLALGGGGLIDEIRIGPSQNSVMLGTKPLASK